MKNIAITTGDFDGVGYEVTAKALAKIGPQKKCQFFLFFGSRSEIKHRALLLRKFDIVTFTDISMAFEFSKTNKDDRVLVEVLQATSPAIWVEQVAKLCLSKQFDSMVTAPLSKQEIKRAGFKDLGHTDILKRVSKKKTAFMAFVGRHFNVLLVSGHLPIDQVESRLSLALITDAIKSATAARRFLKSTWKNKPLAILGLNPHAGDQGLIGCFDQKVLLPLLKKLGKRFRVVGPLVPDVAFMKENWNRYSFYVAQYHDQGLIPFKMIHGFDSGVHLTLGLPIQRTSVDHGTAKDIFGKNIANSKSMVEALRWGVRLALKD